MKNQLLVVSALGVVKADYDGLDETDAHFIAVIDEAMLTITEMHKMIEEQDATLDKVPMIVKGLSEAFSDLYREATDQLKEELAEWKKVHEELVRRYDEEGRKLDQAREYIVNLLKSHQATRQMVDGYIKSHRQQQVDLAAQIDSDVIQEVSSVSPKIACIKVLRETWGLTLKQAKDLYEWFENNPF